MKTTKLFLLSLALTFLLVQGAFFVKAIDCSGISSVNYQLCQSILSMNLTSLEKEALISNLEYSSKYFPDHNYIFLKNTGLTITTPPNGVPVNNGNFVKNAWMNIFTVMPSVIYNNLTYCPSNPKLLTGFNYDLVIPSNYNSPGYSTTDSGDCKRVYSVTRQFAENRVYVNSLYQGSGKLVDLFLTKDSEIKSSFNVGADISIDHYSWRRYCCRRSHGSCVQYCTSCDFSRTETKQDSFTINDFMYVKYYNNTLIGSLNSVDSYGSTLKFKPTYSNSIEVGFNSSYFNFYQYLYSINYSKPPYYIYTLKAEDYNQEQTNNIFKDGSNIVLQNSNNCKVRAFDFFNVIQNNCTSNFTSNNFSIKTDKFYYGKNQIINVSIYPRNISINLTYANQSKFVIGSTTLIPVYPENKITGYYKDQKTDSFIFVYDQSKISLLINIFLFFLIIFLFYRLLKKLGRFT